MRAVVRHWRTLWVVVGVVVPSALLLVALLFDPRDMMTDGGAEGPFAVRGGAVTAERITAAAPGEAFGWTSTLCLKPSATMLARVEFRTVAGRIIETRSRRWMEGQRACGPLPGVLRVPAGTSPGPYVLCRVALLRPDGWWPLRVDLGCLPLDVTAHRPAHDGDQP